MTLFNIPIGIDLFEPHLGASHGTPKEVCRAHTRFPDNMTAFPSESPVEELVYLPASSEPVKSSSSTLGDGSFLPFWHS